MAFDPYASAAPAEAGIPPDILAQLGGGGAPPAEDPFAAEEPVEEGGADPVAVLKDTLADLQEYLEVETDEEDKLEAEKAKTILQGLLAKNQKQADSAMGVTDVHKFMRRQAA